MSVGLVIITHPGIAKALLQNAQRILGSNPIPTSVIEVPMDADLEQLFEQTDQRINQLDQGDGVLILTDLYGSSPCNLAYRFKDNDCIRIISGLNLSMLIRVMNYADASLADLAEKAISGAKDGVRSND